MGYGHRLQASRFELKYVISEPKARAIRDFMRGHLAMDVHGEGWPGGSYPVNSLYLDSPSLALYRQTCDGKKNRFKLRIRFYDDCPESPAFCEIKRRETDVIRKQRASVSRAGVARFLDGFRPTLSHLTKADGVEVPAMNRFCKLSEGLAARPTAYVCYQREAYVTPESDHVRVTFDREIRGGWFDRHVGFRMPERSVATRIGGVVLEIKFTDRFPDWLNHLAQAFNLDRRSVPKYIYCVRAMGLLPQATSMWEAVQ